MNAERAVPLLFVQGAGDLHDAQGSIHLVRYLERELRDVCEVRAPEMPGDDATDYVRWRDRILEELASMEGELVLVGHSFGGSVLLRMLAEGAIEAPLRGLFVMAVPWWGPEGWDYAGFAVPGDVAARLSDVPVFLYHSVDDPEVLSEHQRRYEALLPGATSRRVAGAEHSFVGGLPELVADIKATLATSASSG